MATLFQEEEKDENNQNMPLSSAAPQGMASTVQRQQQGTIGGKSLNIRQYLEANKGAGQQLASGIGSKAQKEAEALKSGITQRSEQFAKEEQPFQQQLGEEGQKLVQTAFKDPQAILQQQNQLQQFQTLRDQGLKSGISGISTDVTPLSSQAGQLAQKGQAAGTETGRFQLLKSTFGQPTYTSGQQKLDQLFLQAQPGSARELEAQLKGIGSQAQKQVGGLSTELMGKQAALQALSGTMAENIQNLLKGGTEAGLEADISGRGLEDIGLSAQEQLKRAQDLAAQVPGLKERFAANQLTPEDIQALGLQSGMQIYGTELNPSFIESFGDPTLAGAMNPEEFARYQALRNLAGEGLAGEDIFGGETQVGTFRPYEFAGEDFQNRIGESKKYWEQDKFKENINSMLGSITPGTSAHNTLISNLKKAQTADDIKPALYQFVKQIGNPGESPQKTEARYQWYIKNDPIFKSANNYLQNLQTQRQNIIGNI